MRKFRQTPYAGYYATSFGEVWPGPNSRRKGFRRLSLTQGTFYFVVRLGKPLTLPVHSVICATFHGVRPFPGAVVRHLDGDHTNNHMLNLAWGTQKENCQDTARHGKTLRGEKNGKSKLTNKQTTEIRRLFASRTNAQIATIYGVCESTISHIRTGRNRSGV